MKNEWAIQRSALALQEAAQDKVAYHQDRAQWWADEQDDAEQQLREHGIDLREYAQTGGARLTAVLDVDLERRLTECQQKLRHHQGLVKEYTGWAEFFGAMAPEHVLQVHQTDFMYFDMAGVQRSE